MSHKFSDGDRMRAICFPYLSDGWREDYIVGENCTKIVVVMENGQGAAVPWFEVWIGCVLVKKVNGAFLASVEPLGSTA